MTKIELANNLIELSKEMYITSTHMTNLFPNNYDIVRHGQELMGASQVALNWAKEIEKEAANAGD